MVENVKKGGFTHVLAGHSAFGKNLMPRIAALLDTQQISDIIDVRSEDSGLQQSFLFPPNLTSTIAFTRTIYAGNAIMTVQSTDSIKSVSYTHLTLPTKRIV